MGGAMRGFSGSYQKLKRGAGASKSPSITSSSGMGLIGYIQPQLAWIMAELCRAKHNVLYVVQGNFIIWCFSRQAGSLCHLCLCFQQAISERVTALYPLSSYCRYPWLELFSAFFLLPNALGQSLLEVSLPLLCCGAPVCLASLTFVLPLTAISHKRNCTSRWIHMNVILSGLKLNLEMCPH
jgi:hypothetical protein